MESGSIERMHFGKQLLKVIQCRGPLLLVSLVNSSIYQIKVEKGSIEKQTK